MNMKKMRKRFWTLNRHHAEGFTLVELIVVIAILAVLGGVAVPAYSGYVEKANKAADIALASEVAHALSLYYYNNGGDIEPGYVVLTAEGVVCYADEAGVGDVAMVATFGDGWEENLSLKHNDWSPRLVNGVGQNAEAILGSSYISGIGTTQLLADVQQCASALGEFLGKFGTDAAGTLAGKLDSGDNTPFRDMMQAAGYYDEKNGYTNVSQEALGNATVFSVSDYVNNNKDSISKGFTSGDDLYLNNGPLALYSNNPNAIYDVACWYAAMEGLVTHVGGDAEKIWREQQGANLDSTNVSGKDAMTIILQMQDTHESLMTQIMTNSDAEAKFMEYYGLEKNGDDYVPSATAGVTQAQKDADAFMAMMGTVNDMSGDFANKEDLNNAGLITSDAVSGVLDAYINTAQNSDQLNSIVGGVDGSCIIIHLLQNGQTVVDPGNMG